MIKILLYAMAIILFFISVIACIGAFIINSVFGWITTAELVALWGVCLWGEITLNDRK
jgi:hypothetical protein